MATMEPSTLPQPQSEESLDAVAPETDISMTKMDKASEANDTPAATKDTSTAAPEDTKSSTPIRNDEPKDPYMGKLIRQDKMLPSGHILPLQGTVVGYEDIQGRLPPRWNVHWEPPPATNGDSTNNVVIGQDSYLEQDLQAEVPPVGNFKLVLDNVQARYKQHIEMELESHQTVSTLLMYAALEEALQTNLHNFQLEAEGGSTTSSASGKSQRRAHPPLYYATNPSTYLKAPTATDTAPSSNGSQVVVTPANLVQRVRAGSQWAWKFLSAQHPPPPPPVTPLSLELASSSTTQRRSLRLPKPPPPPTIAYPTPVQQGGRVAMWWLQQLQDMAEAKEEEPQEEIVPEEEEEEIPASTKSPVKKDTPKPPTTVEESKSNDDHIVDDVEEDEDEEEEPEDDADDDYESKDADMEEDEDEDLENVERERAGTLSPVASIGDEEAEEPFQGDEQENEEEMEHAVMYENPYLKPSFPAFLEYLAQPRSLTGEDVQKALCEAIVRVKFNKRTAGNGLDTEALTTVDQVVLDQETPNYPPGRVVLKSLTEDTFSELQKMDPQVFSRCKFALDVIGDQESSMQVQRRQELILQEIQFKEQKAWDKWRHKGIHEGSTKWPSWNDAVDDWFQQNCTAATNDPTEAPTNGDTKPEAPKVEDTSMTDEALAKSLEENEVGGGRRRTARRAAASASEGVFYGNQSQLTQKQLMDALVRLVKTNRFQTLFRLQSLVADDSTDPIRRSRTAMGRLVWKRNQLLRKPMTSDLSDGALVTSLSRKPLLAIRPPQAPVTESEMEATEPEEVSEEASKLMSYVQHLHATELQLRKLVTMHMAEIPVAIIATAADERPGSMESMDAADFEDPSQISWYTFGHKWINAIIYRPANTTGSSTEMTPCFWYKIQDFSKSIESEAEDKEEADSKERRMRFRAIPTAAPGEYDYEQTETLILTEGQVHAGIKAAEMAKKQAAAITSAGNPFAGAAGGDKVTLVPVDSQSTPEIHGRIVGFNNVLPQDDDEVEFQILVLPDSSDSKEAFWATLDVRADTSSYVCQPIGSSIWFSIEQFDYHQASEASQQCRNVLTYLSRQAKAGPFMHPVDPVALNIPTYTQIVKQPMDISTVTEKLENGQYSNVLPGQSSGVSPAARMLNGPFRKDIELMFDNAMLFNPPDDWIYQAAAQLKRSTLKKIADLSQAADQKLSGGRVRKKSSMYVDEDSDVDMYEYESDNDEEFTTGGRRSQKRKRSARGGAQKDEFAARAIEHPVRLQNTLRDPNNLRGPFGNLPINQNAASFTLPQSWSCRVATRSAEPDQSEENGAAKKRAQEMAELLAMQKMAEETSAAGLRRSTRAHTGPSGSGGSSKSHKGESLEFFSTDKVSADIDPKKALPSNRLEVEVQLEKLHEEYYSKLYQSHSSQIASSNEDDNTGLGTYANGSFPPFLGRVVPIVGWDEVSWEIRAPFIIPALRWVLRGLIESGHLTALEPMTTDVSSGVLISNDVYYWDAGLQPFEVLDLRELQRKKRANKPEEEDSEDDVEMSEYERARAERVARNAERLKALGLA